MPTYCYACDKCGKRIEEIADVAKRAEHVKCECGAEGHRDFRAEQGGMDNGDTWNQTGGFESDRGETGSLSRAIHSDQVKEQIALDKQKGVNTGVEWKPDGRGLVRPHFSSKRARDNWDRAHNFVSESSY